MTTDRTGAEQAVEQAVRLVEEVQTFGLACAASVADRYVDLVERYLGQRWGPANDAPDGPADGAGEDRLLEAADRMAQAWTRSAETMATVLREAVVQKGRPESEALDLPAVSPGTSTSSSVWVHNPTPSPVRVTVRTSAFLAPDGTTLPADAVVLEPRGPVPVEPGAAGEVRCRVDVPRGTPPGHFHAVLTSTATPQQAVSLHLQVLPDGPRT